MIKNVSSKTKQTIFRYLDRMVQRGISKQKLPGFVEEDFGADRETAKMIVSEWDNQ